MCLLVAADLRILAYSIFRERDLGGDFAGNGLAAAFEMAYFLVGGIVIAILASLFLIIRHEPTRKTLIMLLVALGLAIPILR
jgi:hypothetical protein